MRGAALGGARLRRLAREVVVALARRRHVRGRLFLRAAPAHRAPAGCAGALDAYLPELSAETTEYLLKGMPPQFSDAYHMQKGRAAMGAGDKLAELANLPAEKLAELKAAGERVMRGEL